MRSMEVSPNTNPAKFMEGAKPFPDLDDALRELIESPEYQAEVAADRARQGRIWSELADQVVGAERF